MLFLAANAFERKGEPSAAVGSVTRDSGLLSRQAATLASSFSFLFLPVVTSVPFSIVVCVSCVMGILLETAAACSVFWIVEISIDFSVLVSDFVWDRALFLM